jgi:hypothetical protein
MNPSENQNPQTPSQPDSTPEPVQSFAPQAIFSHPPVPLEQIQQQEEQEEKSLKKKRLIKKVAIIIPTSILVIGVLAALLLSGVIPLQKFKTVTYDNGQNSTFKLKFYSKYHITTQDTKSQDLINPDLTNTKTLNQLTSKVSVNSKLPIVLSMKNTTLTKGYDFWKNCTNNAPTAFSTYNKTLNTNVNVCSLTNEDKDILYLGVAKITEQHMLIFIVTQDVDFARVKDQAYAKSVLEKAGLQDYQNDLKTIIGSIQPL